jgi:hypothetical protein
MAEKPDFPREYHNHTIDFSIKDKDKATLMRNCIIKFLEERNMILDTHKGIVWLDKPNAKMAKALKEGVGL